MKINLLEQKKKNITISYNSSIKDAIKLIQENTERTCFVLNEKRYLIGSISDGDIRRGLIKGCKLNDKVTEIYNKNFNFLQKGYSVEDAYKRFTGKINILPIIDELGNFKGIIRKHDLVPFLDIKSKKMDICRK